MLNPRIKLTLFLALLLPVSAALGAESKAERQGKLAAGDSKFIKEAAEGGMMEVELGKIAAERATSEQVKQFGRRMQEDHGKANEDLKTLASNKRVDIPKQIGGKHKSTVNRISKLSGDKFDREYMKAMVQDHKEDVEKFQREADKGKDPDVKSFASKQVPILKEHLELARKTNDQVAGSSKRSSKPKAESRKGA